MMRHNLKAGLAATMLLPTGPAFAWRDIPPFFSAQNWRNGGNDGNPEG